MPYAWIEYRVTALQVTDPDHWTETDYNPPTIRTMDPQVLSDGTVGFYLYGDLDGLTETDYVGVVRINSFNLPKTPAWLPVNRSEAWLISGVKAWHDGGGAELFCVKVRKAGYKPVQYIDWDTVVKIHLTEQTGKQFKKYPLVE